MTALIENMETGETATLEPVDGKYPNIKRPWRVKGTLNNLRHAAAQAAYWANYAYRRCSSCGQKGVYEST